MDPKKSRQEIRNLLKRKKDEIEKLESLLKSGQQQEDEDTSNKGVIAGDDVEEAILSKIKATDNSGEVKNYLQQLENYRAAKSQRKSKSKDSPSRLETEMAKDIKDIKSELAKVKRLSLLALRRRGRRNVFFPMVFAFLFFVLGLIGIANGPFLLGEWLAVGGFFLASMICLILGVGPDFVKRMEGQGSGERYYEE